MLLHTHHLPLFQYIHLLKSQEIKKNLCQGWGEFFEIVCATFYKSIVFSEVIDEIKLNYPFQRKDWSKFAWHIGTFAKREQIMDVLIFWKF